MIKMMDINNEMLPERWKLLPIHECLKKQIIKNVKKFKVTEYLHDGKYPIIDQGRILISGYTNDTDNVLTFTEPIVIFGDHTRSVKFIDFPFAIGADGTKILIPNCEIILPRYLYYYLKNINKEVTSYERFFKYIKKLNLLIPPLDVQQRIVDKLDTKMAQIEIMKKEVEKCIESLEKYHISLNNNVFGTNGNNDKIVSLKDICTIRSGQVDPRKEEFRKLPHIYGVCIESGTGKVLEYNTVEKDKIISGKYFFKSGDVLYSKLRPYLKKVVYVDFDGLCSADMYALDVDRTKINPSWLVLLLLSDEFTRYAIGQSTRTRMPKLNKDQLNAWKFDLPPLEIQNQKLKEFQIRIEQQNQIKINIKIQLNAINQLPASILNEVFGQYQINS